jgi:hypothetical protein
MKHLLSLLLCIALASAVRGAVPLADPKITGASAQVASGTLTVQSGATLSIASGGTLLSSGAVTFTGAGGLTAGGSNQELALLPSGTGAVRVGAGSPAAVFTGSSPSLLLPRESSSAVATYAVASATDTNRGILQVNRSRGTLASPTAVSSGDSLFSFLPAGYDGSAFQQGGEIAAIVDGAVSTGVVPVRWEFLTSAGSGASRTARLVISSGGVVSVPGTTASTSTATGALTTAGGLGVAGRSSTATLNVGGSNGTTLDLVASAAATLDFPEIAAAGGTQDLTITVTGAAVGDAVVLGLPAAPNPGVVFNAFVSAADTVTIRATDATTGSAIDPPPASYRVVVLSF